MDIKQYNDIVLLREVVARELETISQYEAASMEASDEKLRLFFSHLAKEEKEHVSEAVALLHEFDEAQRKEWEEANTSAEHFISGRKKTDSQADASMPAGEDKSSTEAPTNSEKRKEGRGPPQIGAQLTVGSLIKK